MDILTHALSGTAVAACAATFVKTNLTKKVKILFVGTFGGLLPDLDAISLWSRFDSTLGKLFSLPYSGKAIYGMKLWYSHHAFMHSLLAAISFAMLLLLGIYLVRKVGNKTSIKPFLLPNIIYPIAFILGYLAHLVGDLPTPSSVWNGVALFWPSKDYIGGFGKIWWWNNYDIFLIILTSIVLILLIPILFNWIKEREKVFSVLVVAIALFLILFQINTRQYDYSYEGNTTRYAEMEQNSKKEQERILGKQIYACMAWFDSKLKFYF